MRSSFLYLIIIAMVPLWLIGCSYSVDRSKICEDGGTTEEGYGLACETDDDCSGNSIDGGATQCSTLDKLMVFPISDGGMPPGNDDPDTGDSSSDLDEFIESLEPMLYICTNMACELGGCPACYQCCQCDKSIEDIMKDLDVPTDEMDPSFLTSKLEFSACAPAANASILAMTMSCTCS